MDNWKERLLEQYRKRLEELEAKLKEDENLDFEKIEQLLIEEEPKIMKEILDETVKAFPPSERTC